LEDVDELLRRFWHPDWSRICITNGVSLYPTFIWEARIIFWWIRRLEFLVVLLVFAYTFNQRFHQFCGCGLRLMPRAFWCLE
jgi:hypothetical protein